MKDPDTQVDLFFRRLAIIHHLVQQLQDTGKIKLQKLGYFLQEVLGVPLRYKFIMYHYGPYSEQLEDDLSVLKALGYVDVNSDPEGYGYHVTARSEGEPEWSEEIKRYEKQLSTVINEMGELDAASLELLATVHYVKGIVGKAPPDKTIGIVGHLKPKFPLSTVQAAYDQLVANGYVEK